MKALNTPFVWPGHLGLWVKASFFRRKKKEIMGESEGGKEGGGWGGKGADLGVGAVVGGDRGGLCPTPVF